MNRSDPGIDFLSHARAREGDLKQRVGRVHGFTPSTSCGHGAGLRTAPDGLPVNRDKSRRQQATEGSSIATRRGRCAYASREVASPW
jgi:hypothetical protein